MFLKTSLMWESWNPFSLQVKEGYRKLKSLSCAKRDESSTYVIDCREEVVCEVE